MKEQHDKKIYEKPCIRIIELLSQDILSTGDCATGPTYPPGLYDDVRFGACTIIGGAECAGS